MYGISLSKHYCILLFRKIRASLLSTWIQFTFFYKNFYIIFHTAAFLLGFRVTGNWLCMWPPVPLNCLIVEIYHLNLSMFNSAGVLFNSVIVGRSQTGWRQSLMMRMMCGQPGRRRLRRALQAGRDHPPAGESPNTRVKTTHRVNHPRDRVEWQPGGRSVSVDVFIVTRTSVAAAWLSECRTSSRQKVAWWISLPYHDVEWRNESTLYRV